MASATKPPDQPFATFNPSAAEPFDHRRLCHLLRRAALGVSPQRLKRYAGQSPAQVVDVLTGYDPNRDPYHDLLDGLGGISPIYNPVDAQKWWLLRMLDTDAPLQERMALFWHNHFATSTGKVRQSALVSRQIDLFRQKGMGNFRDLLMSVTRDAAMLLWLDGSKNKRGRPNENYAREVMELFTLGIGHYTERDVQELARAFTGWQVLDESVEFFPEAFDDGAKTVLGQTDRFDARGAIDLLLRQPAAPAFIANKLLKEFVHPQPMSEHVEHVAGRIRHYGWEIKPVVREILSSRLFFSDYAWRSKIKSPCEVVVGAILALDVQKDTGFAQTAMNNMGQALLAPPSVKGWDGGEAWINANTILHRYNFALDLLQRQNADKAVAAWQRQGVGTAEQTVDCLAGLLLDGAIAAAAHKQFVDYLGKDENGKAQPFILDRKTFETRVRGVAHLMMCMPEYQLA